MDARYGVKYTVRFRKLSCFRAVQPGGGGNNNERHQRRKLTKKNMEENIWSSYAICGNGDLCEGLDYGLAQMVPDRRYGQMMGQDKTIKRRRKENVDGKK